MGNCCSLFLRREETGVEKRFTIIGIQSDSDDEANDIVNKKDASPLLNQQDLAFSNIYLSSDDSSNPDLETVEKLLKMHLEESDDENKPDEEIKLIKGTKSEIQEYKSIDKDNSTDKQNNIDTYPNKGDYLFQENLNGNLSDFA